MKKSVLVLSIAMLAMVFAACNTHQEELDAAIKKNDSLSLIIQNKDSELDSLFTTLSQIEENLAAVNSRYSAVQELRRANMEGQPNVKSQINAQIKEIESLMSANRQKIASLQAKINADSKEGTRLQELVSRQEERIAQQESQIAQLLTELENNKVIIKKLNQDVTDLTADNEAGIVSKAGGFIGIGRRQGTNSEMPLDRFTQIDRTKVTTIPINMRKALVVSKHPENSYELVMDENDDRVVSYLRILNPAKFWEQTRFLVISTK